MRLVALFSGQGVKKLDFSSFFLSEKNLKEIIDKGSSVLGINLRTEIISEEPKTILNDPYLSQIAVFLYSLLEFKDFERRKDIDTFYQKVVRTFSERTEKTPAHYPGTAMDKRQV